MTKKRAMFFTVAVLFAAACTSLVMQTPPHPAGYPHAAAPAIPGPAILSSNLPQPLSAMSGRDLYDFVKNLSMGGGMIADRACNKWNPGCLFDGGKVKVGIQATADARFLSTNNESQNGTVAAIVENKGKYKTVRYGFEPSDPGEKHIYAFIVFPTGVAGQKYTLEDIVVHGNTYSHSSVDSGNFIGCGHPQLDASMAAFQTCNGEMSRGTVATTGIITMGFDLLAFPKALASLVTTRVYRGGDTPGWVSCADGCCTMGSAN